MAERGPRFASARAALGNAQPQAGRACVLRDRLSALPWCLSMNTQTSFLEDVSTLDVECVKMVYLIYVLTHFHKNVAPGASFCYSLCTSVGESIPLVLLSACPAVSPPVLLLHVLQLLGRSLHRWRRGDCPPSTAYRCCARLVAPPYWRGQLRYAVPSLAWGKRLFLRAISFWELGTYFRRAVRGRGSETHGVSRRHKESCVAHPRAGAGGRVTARNTRGKRCPRARNSCSPTLSTLARDSAMAQATSVTRTSRCHLTVSFCAFAIPVGDSSPPPGLSSFASGRTVLRRVKRSSSAVTNQWNCK